MSLRLAYEAPTRGAWEQRYSCFDSMAEVIAEVEFAERHTRWQNLRIERLVNGAWEGVTK